MYLHTWCSECLPCYQMYFHLKLRRAHARLKQCRGLGNIAIETMVQATAQAKTKRALQTRTLLAGQRMDYRAGDLVDFYRHPSNKDTSGWKGPAKVLSNNTPEHGCCQLQYLRSPFECRFQDMRHHLPPVNTYMSSSQAPMGRACSSMKYLRNEVENLKLGIDLLIGKTGSGIGDWYVTGETRNAAIWVSLLVTSVVTYTDSITLC